MFSGSGELMEEEGHRAGLGSSIAWTHFMLSLCLWVGWNVSKQAQAVVTKAPALTPCLMDWPPAWWTDLKPWVEINSPFHKWLLVRGVWSNEKPNSHGWAADLILPVKTLPAIYYFLSHPQCIFPLPYNCLQHEEVHMHLGFATDDTPILGAEELFQWLT